MFTLDERVRKITVCENELSCFMLLVSVYVATIAASHNPPCQQRECRCSRLSSIVAKGELGHCGHPCNADIAGYTQSHGASEGMANSEITQN